MALNVIQPKAHIHPSEVVKDISARDLQGLNVVFINMPLRETAVPNTTPEGPLLMATAPLRQTKHIDEAIEIFKNKKVDSVVAINEIPASHSPYWTLVINKKGKVTLWNGDSLKNRITRSQDFPKKCYSWNDLVYVFKPENLFKKVPNLYGDNVEPYIIPDPSRYEADINTPDDWEAAEMKFKILQRKRLL